MSVAIVRTIVADPHQFTREDEAVGNGVIQAYQLQNAPVHASTLLVYVGGTLQVNTVDYIVNPETGILTFTVAPGVGESIMFTYEHSLLSDADIQTFLDLNGDNIRRAAADALDTIASSEALIQKRITQLDLKTEGDKVAAALRAHAKSLRELADDELTEEEADGLFDIAEMQFSPFGRIPRERWPS